MTPADTPFTGPAETQAAVNTSQGPVKAGEKARPDDTVSLVIGGSRISGWERVAVVRGLESVPASFDISMTEKYPGQAGEVAVRPGDVCELHIGANKVMTGFVDRYMPGMTPRGHRVRVTGRSKVQDLVDCAAVIEGAQINGASTLELIQKLAKPYGVEVVSKSGPGEAIPFFDVMLGETVYDIAERVARYSGFLLYDDEDGRFVLAQAGSDKMSSGFALPGNVEEADVCYSMDGRFSEYWAYPVSVMSLSDLGPMPPVAKARDSGVPRFRLKVIISEQITNSINIAEKRVQWEAARRFGRSQAISVVCDSWRDKAGKLWVPNASALIDVPALKVAGKTWVIGEVAFELGDRGTRARLVLMPKEAFTPAPQILQTFDWQVARDLAGSGGGVANPGQESVAPGLRAPPAVNL